MFYRLSFGRSLTCPDGKPLRLSSKKLRAREPELRASAAPIAAKAPKWQGTSHGDAAQIGPADSRSARGHEPARLALPRSRILRGREEGVPEARAAGRLPRKRDPRAR